MKGVVSQTVWKDLGFYCAMVFKCMSNKCSYSVTPQEDVSTNRKTLRGCTRQLVWSIRCVCE